MPIPSISISSCSVADFPKIISVIGSKLVVHIRIDGSRIKNGLIYVIIINSNHFPSQCSLPRRSHHIHKLIDRLPSNLTKSPEITKQKKNKKRFFNHQ